MDAFDKGAQTLDAPTSPNEAVYQALKPHFQDIARETSLSRYETTRRLVEVLQQRWHKVRDYNNAADPEEGAQVREGFLKAAFKEADPTWTDEQIAFELDRLLVNSANRPPIFNLILEQNDEETFNKKLDELLQDQSTNPWSFMLSIRLLNDNWVPDGKRRSDNRLTFSGLMTLRATKGLTSYELEVGDNMFLADTTKWDHRRLDVVWATLKRSQDIPIHHPFADVLRYGFGVGAQGFGNAGGTGLQEWFHETTNPMFGWQGRLGDDLPRQYSEHGLQVRPLITWDLAVTKSWHYFFQTSLGAQGAHAVSGGLSEVKGFFGVRFGPPENVPGMRFKGTIALAHQDPNFSQHYEGLPKAGFVPKAEAVLEYSRFNWGLGFGVYLNPAGTARGLTRHDDTSAGPFVWWRF